MIVCVYTLKKRFVIRNKTLRFLNQNASSFYFGQTSYRAKQWKLTLTQLSFTEKYGTHRNRPYSVWNRGQYAANYNSRKHSPQYQQQRWLQNIIYNIQTRSLRWSNSTTGTFIYFLPERIPLCTIGREKNKQDELSGGSHGRFLQRKDKLFQSKNLQKQYPEFPAGCVRQNKNSFQNRQIGGSREKRRTVHQIHSSDT